jgi:hypothetical protein
MKRKVKTDTKKEDVVSKRVQTVMDFLDDRFGDHDGDFNLDKDNGEQYYTICWWNNDSNGSFCTKDDVAGLMSDIISRGYDENFSITVLDIDKNKEVSPYIVDIELG